MKLSKALAAFVLALAAAQVGFGAIIFQPLAELRIDDQSFDIPLKLNDDGLTYSVNSDGPLKLGNDQGQATILLNIDPDPSIAYGLAVTDFGAPSVFAFVFSSPIVLAPGGNVVKSSIVGGLTDFTGDGVSISPALADMDGDGIAEIQVSELTAPATNMGVDVGIGLPAAPGGAGALYNYGSFAAGPIPGPAGMWTGMSQTVTFTLSGGGDVAVLTGFTNVEVPEPASMSVLAIAAGLLTIGRRMRRRA